MAVTLSRTEIMSLPKYVRLGDTTMRLYNPEENAFFCWNDRKVEYYRDAGNWAIDFRIVKTKTATGIKRKIMTVTDIKGLEYLHNKELIPTTYAKWRKTNAGSIYKDTKAYSLKYKPRKKSTKDDIPF